MGGKQSKNKAAKDNAAGSDGKLSKQNSETSTLSSGTAAAATGGSSGVDLAPADRLKLNGERRKSADLLGKEVPLRAPVDAQKEWEAQLASQQESAAWNTTVDTQHGTAKFKSMASLSDKDKAKNSSKDLFTPPTAVVFVLGGPGSGKGTACQAVAEPFNLAHISIGECLRKEAESDSNDGKLIKEHQAEGKLVPLDVTMRILQAAIAKCTDKAGVLLDGFPRSVEQAVEFDKAVGKGKIALYFNCPEEVLLERLRKRAETSGRSDDNEETMTKRLTTYREVTEPVLDHYRTTGLLREVQAQQSVEEVTEAVRSLLATVEFKATSS